MKKESAIKYINNHMNGKENKTAKFIINSVFEKIILAGGVPPLRITKVGQMAEEIEETVNTEMMNSNQSTEGEEISEALEDEDDEKALMAEPLGLSGSSGTYSLSNGTVQLSDNGGVNGIIYNQIILQPNDNQKIVLIENAREDGDSVSGSVTLYPPNSEDQPEVLIPESFDGVASFIPFSKEDGSATGEDVIGFYSMS